MKRRTFGLLAGTSFLALKAGAVKAQTAPDPSLLTTTLTPLGAERAGNADGSIPPWTGGLTSLPPGLKPNDYVPELFPEEKPVLVIDSSNMAQYSDRLSEGVMNLMQKYGFSIKVYPTHRTASAPQYVYDNTAKNAVNAKLYPGGGRFGFEGAYGGVPFPIPDVSVPLNAGTQIVWNHNAKWTGYEYLIDLSGYAVTDGQLENSFSAHTRYRNPFYDPQGSLATFNGLIQQVEVPYYAPAALVGQDLIIFSYTDPFQHPQQAWELLNGQGRVRRAPEISFDTPSSQADGIANYDEEFGFNGSLERYDWHYLGKKEMYIPYNNNGLFGAEPQAAHLPHFLDPNLVRWELHRCWVVEATLHPGERNVLARRKLYIDEDTWIAGAIDAWDGNDNLYKLNIVYNNCRPDLPGVVYANNCEHNLQTGDYVSNSGAWDQKEKSTFLFVDNIPLSDYDPAHMAASAQY